MKVLIDSVQTGLSPAKHPLRAGSERLPYLEFRAAGAVTLDHPWSAQPLFSNLSSTTEDRAGRLVFLVTAFLHDNGGL